MRFRARIVAGLCALALLVSATLLVGGTLLARPAPRRPRDVPRRDPEQTVHASGLSVRVGAEQTVTMGRGGFLTRVDLPFCSYIQESSIRLTVADGTRRTAAHASSVLTFVASSADCAWQTFRFRRPLAVQVGEVVRLMVTPVRGEAPLWASDALKGDPYRGGVGRWRGHTINDFAFRTYVQAR